MKVVVVASALALTVSALACSTVLKIDGDDQAPIEGGVVDGAAVDAETGPIGDDPAACPLTLDLPELDFGEMVLTQKTSRDFVLKNTSDRLIVPALGIAAAAPFEVLLLGEGVPAQGEIIGRVSMTETSAQGDFDRTLTITSPTCKLGLPLHASVVGKSYVAVGVDFGAVPCGTKPANRDLTISASANAAGPATWIVSGLALPLAFAAEMSGTLFQNGTASAPVSLEQVPMGKPGPPILQNANVMIDGLPIADVAVKATPTGAYFTITPGAIELRGMPSGKFEVENVGNASAAVSFRLPAGWTTLPLTLPPLPKGGKRMVTVMPDPGTPSNAGGTLEALATSTYPFCGSTVATLTR